MIRTRTRYSKRGLVEARDYEKCLSTVCHHVSNDEYYGAPFLLEDFQRDNIWKPIFACGTVKRGKFIRKHRRALIGLPSGYGKTEMAAAIVLTVATMEPVYNGQYGVVASSKQQVANIFEKIATMIKLSDDLRDQWEILKEIIVHKETGAKIMVLPNKADALESWHFNVLVFDEVHVYRDDKVWNAGVKGQKVIPNALTIAITTAGESRSGFLWNLIKASESDPGMYVYWLGLNDGDNIDEKRAWKKMMVASWVTWESIQEQRRMATTVRAFERYTANRFPKSNKAESCFKKVDIDACMKLPGFDFEQEFTIGIDGAVSGDSFAVVAYQKIDGIGRTHEWIFDEAPEEGHYNLDEIEQLVADLFASNKIAVGYIDPSRLLLFAKHLIEKYRLNIVGVAQNNANMCQASALVMGAVEDGTISLSGCPKTASHLENTVKAVREPFGIRFGKDEKRSLIDGAIALALAMLAWEQTIETRRDSVIVF